MCWLPLGLQWAVSAVLTDKNACSPFTEEVYRELTVLLAELDSVIGRWPEFTTGLEAVSPPPTPLNPQIISQRVAIW